MVTDRNLKLAVVICVVMQLSTLVYISKLKDQMITTSEQMASFEARYVKGRLETDERMKRIDAVASSLEKRMKGSK